MTDTPPDLEAIAARAEELVKRLLDPSRGYRSERGQTEHNAADLIVTLLDRIRELEKAIEARDLADQPMTPELRAWFDKNRYKGRKP